MAKFIGNDTHTFDIEKITLIHWSVLGIKGESCVKVLLNNNNEVELYYTISDDYKLINQLRKVLGQEPLNRPHW
ncbi:hypothetical protein F7734_43170 [Scytonema sp. UIC 10036]|uniref:hypothetical protein n=1 Tax=Scytonema sp. UIC 10036 TaxID=2304196 RepID=UPI0012DA4D38|nr:hypothetical protein [Scytonema sp. UIC 10036]MUG98735.1 hypothetical protein [Scytonema sp. UIC 10036]